MSLAIPARSRCFKVMLVDRGNEVAECQILQPRSSKKSGHHVRQLDQRTVRNACCCWSPH